MNNKNYFHFTLGPVQGFVSQARRTRDFWAGSFILSWLSAVAIKAVEYQGGDIQFPHANENYMQWLVGEGKNNPPQQGSIPNRFKGLVAAVDPDTFKPEEVSYAVQEAWKALADLVWEKDLGHISPTDDAALIWDRQIENFWDMSWVITPDQDDSAALDKRKNWRSYTPPAEAGVKCMMMEGWQELSGTKSPNRKELKQFWNKVRDDGSKGISNDLKEGEALCAMAFVKRRFSRYFNDLDHNMPQGWKLKGWNVPSAVPSVSYMAAVHWLKNALELVDMQLLNEFSKEAKELTGQYGEWETHINCLDEYKNDFNNLSSLDGNVFFEAQLENPNIFADQKQAEKVSELLKKINKTEGLKPASPFYAVLLMDGDSLGKHMSDPNKQGIISKALNDFTQGVSKIVREKNGFLIYAGGDDVLAILPIENAIPCAAAIRQYYQKCFTQADFTTSISAAIQFVHIKTALIKILRDSHDLLDNIAKDKTGRDAIAIRVWKPGGKQLEWAQPWDIALTEKNGDKTHLEELAASFIEDEEKDKQFSNKFFFKIRERFDLLNPDIEASGVSFNCDSKNETEESVENKEKDQFELTKKQTIDLMTMEYLNSFQSGNKGKDINAIRERVKKLLTQCRPHKRQDGGDCIATNQLHIDGALLIRFLAQKGAE